MPRIYYQVDNDDDADHDVSLSSYNKDDDETELLKSAAAPADDKYPKPEGHKTPDDDQVKAAVSVGGSDDCVAVSGVVNRKDTKPAKQDHIYRIRVDLKSDGESVRLNLFNKKGDLIGSTACKY